MQQPIEDQDQQTGFYTHVHLSTDWGKRSTSQFRGRPAVVGFLDRD